MRINDWSSDVCASDLMGHLDGKALHCENMRNVRHRTKPADARMRGHRHRFDPEVGNVEWNVHRRHAQFEGLLPLRIGHEGGSDGRRRGAVQPGHRLALRIEAGFQALDRHRVKVVVVMSSSRDQVTLTGLPRSEEHTSELQSLMRISYAVFCLKKKN